MNRIATVYKIGSGNLANEEQGDCWQGTLAEQYFNLGTTRVDIVVKGGILRIQEEQRSHNANVHKNIEAIIEKDIHKYMQPLLSPERESELGLQIKTGTSIDELGIRKLSKSAALARDELFFANISLALKIASKFISSLPNTYISSLDLKQVALTVLFEVCGRYDGRGAFSSYAYPSIDGQMRSEIKVTRRGFSTTRGLLDLDRQVRGVKSAAESNGKLLSSKEIRRQLVRAQCKRYEIRHKHKPDRIVREQAKRGYSLPAIRWVMVHRPYNRPHPQALHGGNLETLKVADGEIPGSADLFELDRSYINLVVSTLPPRERFVIENRFGLGEKSNGRIATLAELGELWGISREAIHKTEKKALKRLSNRLREFAPESQSE